MTTPKTAEQFMKFVPLNQTYGQFQSSLQAEFDAHWNAAIEAAADKAIKEQTGNPATLSHYLRCEHAILSLKRPTQ